jgi:hypothetical protein
LFSIGFVCSARLTLERDRACNQRVAGFSSLPMSLEAMPRDLFQLLARELHFVDFVPLLCVSKTIRAKVLACPGAWRAISFALLPLTSEAATCEEWHVDAATRQMVRLFSTHGINAFVSTLSFGYKQVSDLAPVAELHNLRELTIHSKAVRSLAPLCGLKLRAVSVEWTCDGLPEFLQSQPELEELSLIGWIFVLDPPFPSLSRVRKLELQQCRMPSVAPAGRAMPNVTELSLSGSNVDADLFDLHILWPRLRLLNLCNAKRVNDRLMREVLVKLRELEQVALRMTEVTGVGIAALYALPKLRVVEQPAHLT